ncbi:MAG: ABC transporter ATP-binding protein [Chloroflexi bacterium]|nr:ABC transporter ATP-binding protein [Chloroflexota bacterium]MBI2976580.1 ABC transporter ATP-binding protein [Chloroflexota bacterium]MBI4315982.1 ABC transporter ATP-binding protein [Chloroflexota bacterium]
MIQAQGLTKHFEDFHAVEDVSLTVSAGQVLALLGPNGAGKTTTVRMLTAVLKPTRGTALVAGYDVVRQPDQVRGSVGVLTENHGLYLRSSGAEYLDFFGDLYGIPAPRRRRRIGELLERFGMAEAAPRRIGEYSKGMRQKLAIIRAMLHDPPVLLLDEPTSAMDPQSAKLVRDAIVDLRTDRRAVIICTHNLAEAEMLADTIAIIRKGRIIASGPPESLKDQLLGPALMELRLAGPSNGLAESIADLVTVLESGDGWLRYSARRPQETNPRLLNRLGRSDVPVLTLTEVPRSLESVYLRAVEEDER